MTLNEVKEIPKEWLTEEDVAPYLECNPQSLRLQAQEAPAKFSFPVAVMGKRVKINKHLFVLYFGGAV